MKRELIKQVENNGAVASLYKNLDNAMYSYRIEYKHGKVKKNFHILNTIPSKDLERALNSFGKISEKILNGEEL